MNAFKIKEDIYGVGAIDWNIRQFHGYETGRGTTYGAYLILDEKITLIDTVKAPFTEELLSRINSVIPVSKIEIIISNHVEMDHSGALPALRKLCPNAIVYTAGTAGINGLTAHYGSDNYQPVKSGDTISIGKRSLQFVATPMLHWPDNMVTYCPEEKILFSNDAFGQHLATSEHFDEEANFSVAMEEAQKYYANILMRYSMQVRKTLQIVRSLDLEMIVPSHGIIWQAHIQDILNAYDKWSLNAPEIGAMVVYDSMWQSTEQMARSIAEAFGDLGIPTRFFDLKENHPSNILPHLLTCKYIAVGSSTLNCQMLPSVAAFLCYLKGLSPRKRQAFAFGSYGWSGQGISGIEKELQECGFDLCMEAVKINYLPSAEQLETIYNQVREMITNNN